MQKLSLGDQWLVYDREEAVNPRFAVKKHKGLLHSTKALARVTAPCTSGSKSRLVYDVEGSYSRRCCVVYDDRRRQLAEIKKKESAQGIALGLDVFRLIVEPELDAAFAMAVVILLEQMFGSRRSLLGEACVFMRLWELSPGHPSIHPSHGNLFVLYIGTTMWQDDQKQREKKKKKIYLFFVLPQELMMHGSMFEILVGTPQKQL